MFKVPGPGSAGLLTGKNDRKLEVKLKISEHAVDRDVFGAGVDFAVTRLPHQIDILLRTVCGRWSDQIVGERAGAGRARHAQSGPKGYPPPSSADVKGSLLAVSRINASSDHELVVPPVELGHLFLARLSAGGGDLGQLFEVRLTRCARGEENQH